MTPHLQNIKTNSKKINGALKRIFDIIVSSLVLVLISPLLVAIACLIKTTSRGPVLFKQDRHGFNNKIFKIYKFRTMHYSKNETRFQQAQRNDPRITPVGLFLRRTSMDELPQFINVIMGHMSMVGPRPHPVELNNQFRDKIANFDDRHTVKPGLTGLAQICGWRGETDTFEKMAKRVEHDLEYINHSSFWYDLRIFFLTIIKVITGKNAF